MLQTVIASIGRPSGRQLINEILSLRGPSQPDTAETPRSGTSVSDAGYPSRTHDQILPMVLAMAMRPRQRDPITGRAGLGSGLRSDGRRSQADGSLRRGCAPKRISPCLL